MFLNIRLIYLIFLTNVKFIICFTWFYPIWNTNCLEISIRSGFWLSMRWHDLISVKTYIVTTNHLQPLSWIPMNSHHNLKKWFIQSKCFSPIVSIAMKFFCTFSTKITVLRKFKDNSRSKILKQKHFDFYNRCNMYNR